jgi:N-carbamoylputrescine amidase
MVRIALAQIDHADLVDVDCRVEVTCRAIDDAAAAGAQFVVLPELAACGYVLDETHLGRWAEPGDASGAVVGAWREACARHGVAVVGGFAERAGDAIYNSAVALDRSGAVAGRYRKLHLFGAERDLFTAGDLGLPVIDLEGLRVGMLICYDLRFPEAARILALQDAEVIAVPTAWVGGFDRPGRATGRQIGQIEAAVVHANLNQVYVACADFVGTSPGYEFLGRSLLIDPYGDIVEGPLDPDRPGVILTDVDPAVVAGARERGPNISPRRNRRTDVYEHLLGYHPPTDQELTP